MRSPKQLLTNSLGNYCRANSQLISANLISQKNWNQIITIGDHFSMVLVSIFGFEYVLNNPKSTTDFFFCIRSRQKHHKFLDNENPLLNHYLWQNIALFYQNWQDQQTILAQKISDIWLEFDHEQYSNQIPIPSVFFDATKINSQSEWQWIIENSLSQLLGQDIPKSQIYLFLKTISQLPKNVNVFQVGLLLSRPQQNIRIYTTAIAITQIRNYLTKLNWQGNIDLLVNILQRVSSLVDKYQLQIEIGHELASAIAIEFYCYNQNNLQSLLYYLTATEFCLPEKRDALLVFPDSSTNFSRRIAYLKMTYTPNNPLQFKAYLGITPKIRQ